MTIPTAARPLAVRLDVPEALRAKARYALSELLHGLGFALVDADGAAPDLTYGPASVSGALHLPLAPDAADRLATPEAPLDPAAGGWLDGVHGERLPLAFGTPDAPDLVATAFVWLAGWAEAHGPRDAHGRFPHTASWQAALDLPPDLPVVDALRLVLAERLRAHGLEVPGRTLEGAPFGLALTVDVDALHRLRPGIFKQVWWDDLVRNAKGEPFAARRARADRLLGDAMRPGDPYLFDLAWLADTFAPEGGGTFFLKAGHGHAHDTPVDLGDEALRALADLGHEIAFHPSYGAAEDAARFGDEQRALAAAFPSARGAVRYHYLRFDPLASPARLEAAGVALDSSLGWAETAGFRRGTAHPFALYDLAMDRPTAVLEVPLVLMDVALFVRAGTSAEAGRDATVRLLDAAARYGGVLSFLWHNTLSEPDVNPAGRAHVAETIAAAKARGARLGPVSALAAAWRG